MSIAPTGDFSMNQLANMSYLEMVIKESLRLHTLGPYLERQVLDEFELGKFMQRKTNVKNITKFVIHLLEIRLQIDITFQMV